VKGPVLITGANGFAGSHLLQLLAGRYDLVAWGRSSPHPEFLSLARWQHVDLLDRDRVRALVHEVRPTSVYHLAGSAHVADAIADPARAFANNVLGTHHLFDGLRRAGSSGCRIVIAGSAALYRSSDAPLAEDSPVAPGNPYAQSKLAQEQLALRAIAEDGLDIIVARPFNHTGPRQTASYLAPTVARQIALIEQGQLDPVLRIGNTSARRDLSDVRDVVRAYEALMQHGTPGTIYNIASGFGRSVQQIIDALIARSRVAVRIEVDPARLRASDAPILVGDASRLTRATGWQPEIPFERTIDDLLEYWRSTVREGTGTGDTERTGTEGTGSQTGKRGNGDERIKKKS
jgi:GDP-4-dehydro-6-deoxy-D-mannose reductase